MSLLLCSSAVFRSECSSTSISLCFLISLQRHRALKYRARQRMDSLIQQRAQRPKDKQDQSDDEEDAERRGQKV